MSTRTVGLVAVLLMFATTDAVSGEVFAEVETNGFSFGLGPAATNDGLTIFFTTYDGSTGLPLRDCGGNFCTISQEFSPIFLGSTTYRADYLVQDSFGVFEYGTVTISLSANDSNRDGLLDPLERDRSGNFSFSGNAVPHFNSFGIYVNSAIQGNVVRGASSMVGAYSGTFSNPYRSPTFAGAVGLTGPAGTVHYDIGGPTLRWNLSMRSLDGSMRSFSGVSAVDRIGTSAIRIPGFALSDSSSGLALLTQTATLSRMGNLFRGVVHVFDGEPLTSWADYTDFQVEITDSNDADGDGVPDILSLPEPASAQLAVIAVVLALRRSRARLSSRPG